MLVEGQLSLGGDEVLDGFGPPLMVHAPASNAPVLGPFTRSLGVGAILIASTSVTTRAAVRHIRRANPNASILLDRDRYSGFQRRYATDLPSQSWVDFQRGLHLPWALTDSGYIPAGNRAALVGVLQAAQTFGPNVIAALPMARQWLTHDANQLIEEVNRFSVPIALIMESEMDPLGSPEAVQGLATVLNSAVPVLLLRSDVAAIGALAYGAAAAAVGSTSRLRHLYPKGDEPAQGGAAPSVSAVVPDLASYRTLHKIDQGIAANRELDLWRCDCTICGGRRLDWIANSLDPAHNAFEHSCATLAALADRVLGAGTSAERRAEWLAICAVAQAATMSVLSQRDGTKWWPAADNLKAWRTLAISAASG